MEKSIVYFTKNITPENLTKMYEKLGERVDRQVGRHITEYAEEIISTSK